MVSRVLLSILLFFTGFGHFIEFISALIEKAYVTSIFALTFAVIELVASYYVDECNCDKTDNNAKNGKPKGNKKKRQEKKRRKNKNKQRVR